MDHVTDVGCGLPAPGACDCPPCDIHALTPAGLDPYLDGLASVIRQVLAQYFSNDVRFALILGTDRGYRGSVTSINAAAPVYTILREAADHIEKTKDLIHR